MSAASSSHNSNGGTAALPIHSLRIPLLAPANGATSVEVFPDELPDDAGELMDVLISEYAPLRIWKSVALEYHRQGLREQFLEILNSISSEIARKEVHDHYVEKKDIKDIAFVYGALAADLISGAGFEGMGDLAVARVSELLNKAEGIDKQNEYIWLLGGFLQIQRGQLDSAETHFKRISSSAYQYGANVGLGVVLYLRQRYAQALDFLTKAIQQNASAPAAVKIAAAVCCFYLNDHNKARGLVEKAMAMDPASVDGLVVLSLLDLAAAQKATQNRTELRKKAHEYAMVAEKIGSHLLTSTGSSKAAMINHGTAIAMAMNHLANQAFYTWKVLDHHAHASQQAATDPSAAKMLILSAAASRRYSGGLVSAGDFIRVNKNFHSIVDDVISTPSGDDTVICIVLRDALPSVALTHKGPLNVELKEVNRMQELLTKALQSTTNKDVRAESLYMQGRLQQQLGEISRAKALYEQAVQLSPDLTLAQFGLGQIYLSLKELSKAAELFGKVRAAHPEDRDTQAYLFLINSLSRQELAPYEKLREVSQGFHYEADLWILQGQLRLRFETEFPIALKCFEFALAALEAHKKHIDPTLLCNIGVLHMSLGNVKNAWKFLRWGLTSLETDLRNGRAEANGLKSEVANHVNPVLYGHENDIFYSWSPVSNISVHVMSAEAYATAKGESFSSALEHSLQHRSMCSYFKITHEADAASFALETGDHVVVGDVAVIVEEVFKTRDGTHYFMGKGMVCMHAENPRYSAALLMQKKYPGINFNEKTTSLCYNYARTLEELGHANSAKEIYFNILKIHPHFLECYIRLSKQASALGRMDTALSFLQRALGIDAKNIDALSALGDLYYCQGRYEDSTKIFDDLCKQYKDMRAHIVVGNIRRIDLTASTFDIKLKESYKYYYYALDADKKNCYAANGLGIVLAEKNKLDAARDIFTRVRESTAPESDLAHSACVNLATVHLAQKRYVDAIHLYQTTMKSLISASSPAQFPPLSGIVDVGSYLAAACMQHGVMGDAKKHQQRVLMWNPTLVHSWFNLVLLRGELSIRNLQKDKKTTQEIVAAKEEFRYCELLLRRLMDIIPKFSPYTNVSRHSLLGRIDDNIGSNKTVFSADGLSSVYCTSMAIRSEVVLQLEKWCQANQERCDPLLFALRQEETDQMRRRDHEAQQRQRESSQEEEKAAALRRAEEEQRMELQRKALEKARELEELKKTWAAAPAPAEKKSGGGRRKKGGASMAGEDGIYDSDEEAGAAPLKSKKASRQTEEDGGESPEEDEASSEEEEDMSDSGASEEEEENLFGSSDSEGEGKVQKATDEKKKKRKKDKEGRKKKSKKDKKEKKRKHKKDRESRAAESSKQEEAADASAARLKRKAVDSDDDDGELFADPPKGAAASAAMDVSDDVNASSSAPQDSRPVKQRRVVDDDEE